MHISVWAPEKQSSTAVSPAGVPVTVMTRASKRSASLCWAPRRGLLDVSPPVRPTTSHEQILSPSPFRSEKATVWRGKVTWPRTSTHWEEPEFTRGPHSRPGFSPPFCAAGAGGSLPPYAWSCSRTQLTSCFRSRYSESS